jgi:extradiol dioxygenase family protein
MIILVVPATDGDPVPVPHFGLAMSVSDFHALAERVKAAGIKFLIEPHIRFVGQPGEQVNIVCNTLNSWKKLKHLSSQVSANARFSAKDSACGLFTL